MIAKIFKNLDLRQKRVCEVEPEDRQWTEWNPNREADDERR